MRHRRGFVLEHSKHACINNGVYVHTDETVGGAPVFRYRQTDDKLHGDKALFWSAQQSMWVFTWHYSGLNETVINNASGPGIAMRCKFKNPSFGGPEAPIGNIPWQVKEQLPSCRRPIASWTEKPITVRARYKNDLTAAELALEEAVDAATRQSKNELRGGLVVRTALEAYAWADGVLKPQGKWDNFPVYKSASATLYRTKGHWAILPVEQCNKITMQEGRGYIFHKATDGLLPLNESMYRTKPWQVNIDGALVETQITVRARTVLDVEGEMRSALRQQEKASKREAQLAKERSESEALLARQDGALAGFEQGLRCRDSRRVDISGPSFGQLTPEQLKSIACRVPDLEALILKRATVLSEDLLAELRVACPHAGCLALGCEISEEGYLELRAQYEKNDAELAQLLCIATNSPHPSTLPRMHTSEHTSVSPVCDSVASPQNRFEGTELLVGRREPELAQELGTVTSTTEPLPPTVETGEYQWSSCALDGLALMKHDESDDTCRVLDLSGPLFRDVTDSGLAEISCLCLDVDAVFLPVGTKVTKAGLDAFRRQCRQVRVVSLGGEVTRRALLELLTQYKQTRRVNMNCDKFAQVTCAGLAELLALCPDIEAIFTNPDSKLDRETMSQMASSRPSLRCLVLGSEISSETYKEMEQQLENTHMLDLTGEDFCLLSAAGIAELVKMPRLIENVRAIFTDQDSDNDECLIAKALQELQPQCGSQYKCVTLGCEISREAYLMLINDFEAAKIFDFTDNWMFANVTNAGLRELLNICELTKLRAAFFTETFHKGNTSAIRELQALSPTAHLFTIGEEIHVAVRTTAQQMKKQFDDAQVQLRSNVSPEACKVRNELRLGFIVAAQAFSQALVAGSAAAVRIRMLEQMEAIYSFRTDRSQAAACMVKQLEAVKQHRTWQDEQMETIIPEWREAEMMSVIHLARVRTRETVKHDGHPPGYIPSRAVVEHALTMVHRERAAWRRVSAEAQQFEVLAARWQCIDINEPAKSQQDLRAVQLMDAALRQEVENCRARIVLLEGKRRASLECEDARITPEQRRKRSALLAETMESWTEAQVQEWIGLIGLHDHAAEDVKQALAADNFEGEDLAEITKRRLHKLLKKTGARDSENLATQTMMLHEKAQTGAAHGRLVVAQNELAASCLAVRKNSAAVRKTVVQLVSLATEHFPELFHNEQVKVFMGSDGLHISDRRLADYDDRRMVVLGRLQLVYAKFQGVEVILKQFPLHDDMRGYMKEITSVQRIRHRNIIRFNAVFEDEGSMYIEMEYCRHGTLREWLDNMHPDDTQVQSVMRQVLLALVSMHEEKIVHCDLKSDNILIAEDGTPRICDFELSKNAGALSATTMAGGTLGFIAPEVQSRAALPSAASDIYAFGVVLLNTLSKPADDHAFPQTDASVLTSPELRKLVKSMLAQNPKVRPTAVQLQAHPFFAIDRVALPLHWKNQQVDPFQLVKAPERVLCDDLRIGTTLAKTLMRASILPSHGNGCNRRTNLRHFIVTRVEQVENRTLWLNYQRQKTALHERLQYHRHVPEQLMDTWTSQSCPSIIDDRSFDAEANEFGLWHGTRPELTEVLSTAGFDERVGGETNGGLYGKGCYFTDAMCKANQYSQQVNADGEHCVLYCLVTMGSAYRTDRTHTNERRPPDNPAMPGAPFDSIFAEKGVANAGRQIHNEFVVFRHDQVYPMYIVWYRAMTREEAALRIQRFIRKHRAMTRAAAKLRAQSLIRRMKREAAALRIQNFVRKRYAGCLSQYLKAIKRIQRFVRKRYASVHA